MSFLDIDDWPGIEVRVEFTEQLPPALLAEGRLLYLVSLHGEIEANNPTSLAGQELREKFGTIPYSSPLYWWEIVTNSCAKPMYIGQTVAMQLQNRFENHSKVLQLLAGAVNDPSARVFFRLCSRLDIRPSTGGSWKALEWVAPKQASQVVTDVESRLIYEHQPELNVVYKKSNPTEKTGKPLSIVTLVLDAHSCF